MVEKKSFLITSLIATFFLAPALQAEDPSPFGVPPTTVSASTSDIVALSSASAAVLPVEVAVSTPPAASAGAPVVAVSSASAVPPLADHAVAPVTTPVTEASTSGPKRMTLVELQDFFGTLDRGRPIRLVYKDGSEYAGNYSGSETDKPMIYCRKGMSMTHEVPLDTVSEAYVFTTNNELVKIRRRD